MTPQIGASISAMVLGLLIALVFMRIVERSISDVRWTALMFFIVPSAFAGGWLILWYWGL